MKNLFSLVTLFLIGSSFAFAQCTPAESMNQSAPYIYVGDVLTNSSQTYVLPEVTSGVAYELTLSLLAPTDTTFC